MQPIYFVWVQKINSGLENDSFAGAIAGANIEFVLCFPALKLNFIPSWQKNARRPVAYLFIGGRGKSGQRRATYFLTGRGPRFKPRFTDSATENYRICQPERAGQM